MHSPFLSRKRRKGKVSIKMQIAKATPFLLGPLSHGYAHLGSADKDVSPLVSV